MKETETRPNDHSTETSEDWEQEFKRRADEQWCLRRLGLIATKKLPGDYFTDSADEAVNKIGQSAGSIYAENASCFKSDCHVRVAIESLADNSPDDYKVYIVAPTMSELDKPKPLEP